jgi:putative ABC transport system ATP-binding protein
MMDVVIQTKKLSKEYVRDENRVTALKNVDFQVPRGDFLALMGPSGSGKSTLLHLIAAMDRPSSGEVLVLGQDLRSLSGRELARWRNAHTGFIFQSFNLIPVLTALENVMLPLKLTDLSTKQQSEHATTALQLVGLEDRLQHFPRQLSGGQEQRVAIARAIVTDPGRAHGEPRCSISQRCADATCRPESGARENRCHGDARPSCGALRKDHSLFGERSTVVRRRGAAGLGCRSNSAAIPLQARRWL